MSTFWVAAGARIFEVIPVLSQEGVKGRSLGEIQMGPKMSVPLLPLEVLSKVTLPAPLSKGQ